MTKKQYHLSLFKIWNEINLIKFPENKGKLVFYHHWYMSEDAFTEFIRKEKEYKIGIWADI